MPGFVIEYNRRTGEWRADQFAAPQDALTERLRREVLRTDPDIEIASLNSDSLETVKHTHSRYFQGNEFVSAG